VSDINTLDGPHPLEAILAETERLGFGMASEPRTGRLLRTLAQTKPGGLLLELGTGTGVASAWLLDGLDADARLITVEHDGALASVAQTHLGGDPRVTFCVEDASAFLSTYIGERFDLIFADTWAGKYTMLNEAVAMLKVGGLYVIDDMMPQASWPEGHEEKVRELVAELEARQDLRVTTLEWASGIIVAAKRAGR
jgi:predicted O-methyltransferase YrrM